MHVDIVSSLVLIFLILLSLEASCVLRSGLSKTFPATAAALGLAFISLALCQWSISALAPSLSSSFAAVIFVLIMPIVAFSVVFGIHVIKYRPRIWIAVLALVSSSIAFVLVGFYILLVIGCSFGDCV